MFFNNQANSQKLKYQDFLKIAGCLSNMFSDSEIPYLYYRVAEKVFCRSFDAEDLSRSDVSTDAKKNSLGIGLKTFLKGNDKTFQKIAEFNKDRPLYAHLESKKIIEKVAELRNARIQFTENTHALENSIYHCILRDSGKFKIFEEPMEKINIANICDIKERKNSIVFNDEKNEYSFLLSKSTQTHPNATPLGWKTAQEVAKKINIPVYFLGGMGLKDLNKALKLNAQGIAGVSAF
jgi:hypothetical protein